MGSVDDRDLLPMRPTFDIVRRGYDCAQVEYQLEHLRADLQIALTDRDAGAAQGAELNRALESARGEIDDLRAQVKRLAAPPTSVEGMSERVARMLQTAQAEAADIAAKATTAAATTRMSAEREAEELRARYEQMIEDAQRRRSQMEAERERILADARRRGEEIVALATQRGEQLEAEATVRRQQADEDFEITMSARRREAVRDLEEEDASSKAEAKRRIDEATDVARRLVTEADQTAVARIQEATRRVEALRGLRRQLTGQLQSVSTKLDEARQHLTPAPDEADVLTGEQTPRN
ncbi:MAG: chromosome segregation protein [Pseudonocardiaceae bacterium]